MSLYARSDLASVTVSAAHGGCGTVHVRPAPGGKPSPVWKLSCVPCEAHLRTDPMWSGSLSEVPETPTELREREDFEKRGAIDRDLLTVRALAKLAGEEIPDTMRRAVNGRPVVPGLVECPAGHASAAGSKFCGECGAPLRVPEARRCPDGHEVPAGVRFCGECGSPVGDRVPALTAAAPAPVVRRMKDMRAEDLKALARQRGLDDSGTRTEVLARLRAA